MQTLIFAIAIGIFNIGVVEWSDSEKSEVLVCVDNGRSGVCIDKTLNVASSYDCGPKGCAGF